MVRDYRLLDTRIKNILPPPDAHLRDHRGGVFQSVGVETRCDQAANSLFKEAKISLDIACQIRTLDINGPLKPNQ